MSKRLYIIAGEPSGDQLAGMLVEELRTLCPDITYRGIGGFSMMQQGVASIFPMRELSLMGFAEIIPHLWNIKKRIRQTVQDIEQFKPDILLTIDAPGFNFRVVKQLKARGIHTPRFVHYVAPTVWAYKPERADVTAQLFDHLLCLLPFESAYFEGKMPVNFVGHPMAWWWRNKGLAQGFRTHHHIPSDAPLIACFPGSRMNELKRHLPIMRGAITQIVSDIPNLHCTIYIREEIAQETYQATRNWPCKLTICNDTLQKKQLFAASDMAIAKSGTISLECALAGLPSVTIYKTHPISAWYIKNKIKTPHVNLANILAGKRVIPELLQSECNVQNVAKHATALLQDETTRNAQLRALENIADMLGVQDSISPSVKAASIIMRYFPNA
jgi:lipid-A-disaccharide synthase